MLGGGLVCDSCATGHAHAYHHSRGGLRLDEHGIVHAAICCPAAEDGDRKEEDAGRAGHVAQSDTCCEYDRV